MRNVILYVSMSLDGFVGSDREHPGMAIPEGAELKQWKLDRISTAGAHLMGRVTYQQMASYWPQSGDEYTAPMNDIPKVVFPTTLSDAEASWPVTRVARGDLATEITAIKARARPGRDRLGRCTVRRRADSGRPDRRIPSADPAVGAGPRAGAVRPTAGLAAPEPHRGRVVSSGVVVHVYRPQHT